MQSLKDAKARLADIERTVGPDVVAALIVIVALVFTAVTVLLVV